MVWNFFSLEFIISLVMKQNLSLVINSCMSLHQHRRVGCEVFQKKKVDMTFENKVPESNHEISFKDARKSSEKDERLPKLTLIKKLKFSKASSKLSLCLGQIVFGWWILLKLLERKNV